MRVLALLLTLAACAPDAGMVAETGALTERDPTLNTGEFSDDYAVEVEAGQWLTVSLLSNTFDPYLIVRSPAGEQLENDDADDDARRSTVVVHAAETGRYAVLVTSYDTGETGAYTLVYEVADTPPARAAETPPSMPAPNGLPPGHPALPGAPPSSPPAGPDPLSGGVRI